MAKNHVKFICQSCGYESAQFMGKCPNCGEWNAMVETIVVISSPRSGSRQTRGSVGGMQSAKPVRLADIKTEKTGRISTGIVELDQILGSGLVPGQVVLLAGEPGVGKSTLLLQLANKIQKFSGIHFSGSVASVFREKKPNRKTLLSKKSVLGTDLLALQNDSLQTSSVLYISGEESVEQISIRARRLGIDSDRVELLAETSVENITEQIGDSQYLIIIDSIQTLWTEGLTGTPGSVGQVRECARILTQIAKTKNIPLIIVGHVTKEGAIAGPKVLEHLVDTVLYLEGERFEKIRILRVSKNRFGPTDEVGVFQMEESGFKEVFNPSEMFFEKKDKNIPGSCLTVVLEGTRPLLVEIQALVSFSELKSPRRIGNGVSYNRLIMLCAIVAKHLRVPLEKFDVYVNISGGLKIEEPAADLAIALAVYSSLKNKSLPVKSCFIGELSLLGQVRAVGNMEKRSKEAKKLGFSKIFSKEKYSTLKELVTSI